LTTFPSGANDDQVDASSGAFNKLAIAIGSLVDFA
jgi:phage terminase large subunit-like protein